MFKWLSRTETITNPLKRKSKLITAYQLVTASSLSLYSSPLLSYLLPFYLIFPPIPHPSPSLPLFLYEIMLSHEQDPFIVLFSFGLQSQRKSGNSTEKLSLRIFCYPSHRHASSNVNVSARTACDYCNATCIVSEAAVILNVVDMLLTDRVVKGLDWQVVPSSVMACYRSLNYSAVKFLCNIIKRPGLMANVPQSSIALQLDQMACCLEGCDSP